MIRASWAVSVVPDFALIPDQLIGMGGRIDFASWQFHIFELLLYCTGKAS